MGWGSANIHSLNYPYLEDLRRERRLVDGQCAGAEQQLQRRRQRQAANDNNNKNPTNHVLRTFDKTMSKSRRWQR
jgi:hypothetical protein